MRHRGRPFFARTGFTVLELLVVIGIIALISSMLLPALRQAKERTNALKCVANLNQIALAINTYGHDHGYYPQCHSASFVIIPNATNNGPWYAQIRSQLGSPQTTYVGGSPNGWTNLPAAVFCPSSTIKPPFIVNTYSAHKRVLLVPTGVNGLRLFPLQERPGEIVLMADGIQSDPSNGWDADNLGDGMVATALPVWAVYNPATADNLIYPPYDSDPAGMGFGHIRWRHQGRANFLFVDGHAQSINKDSLYERYIKFSGPIP